MIGYKEIKAFELETDRTEFCLVQTFFIGGKKTFMAHEQSWHMRGFSWSEYTPLLRPRFF